MEVVVQSFGEFKSSQMANAADSHHTLNRYVLAELPRSYSGPSSKLRVYRTLRLLQAGGYRIDPWTDFSSYWTNRALDTLAARGNPECDLFVGYSGSCLTSLRRMKTDGATTVVYRGAPHGQFFQTKVDELVRETGFEQVKRDTGRMTPREHEEYEAADLVWVPSTFTAESLSSFGIDEGKIRTFPYGVDLELFEPRTDRSADPFEILYVGEVSPEKGVHVLLEAIEELDGVQATLVGKVSSRLTEMIDETANVEAVGWVDRRELASYYQNASALVFPSLADGYPSVVLEALACGCPVITTRNVGTRGLIEEFDAGLVVKPGSSTALTNAIESVRSEERLDQMSENAVRAIEKQGFAIEQRQEAMASFMDSLVGGVER